MVRLLRGTMLLCVYTIVCVYGMVASVPLNEEGHDDINNIQFDWREKGVISSPSNLGQTGNSLTVCKREAVESLSAIMTHKLVDLSTNQVVDCCNNMNPNFDCIQKKLGGLCSAIDYGKLRGYCPAINCTHYGKISGTHTLPQGDEEGMKQALTQGPLLAYINANVMSFQEYTSGIYADPKCTGKKLDHMVQIVGYGVNGGNNEFWIIKNSWGPRWGEKGYMYIQRGHNMCGIANHVFYPYS